MYKKVGFIAILACLSGLAACSNAKEQLGLTRSAPDEYAIVKRAPLEMPPDYALRPPRPGMARPQEAEPGKQAQMALFGNDSQQSSRKTPEDGESALLQQAGADNAQPGIRQQVDRETALLEPQEKPVIEKLLGWAGTGSEKPPATVVDAKAEAERLKKNAEEGRPVTEGNTPTIKV